MSENVAREPRWLGALVVCAVLSALAVAFIPPELLEELRRRAALERGVTLPEMSDTAVTVMRVMAPLGAAAATFLFSFVIAGFYATVFVFVLGDEGRYRQYLSIHAHALVIPSLAGLVLAPLRISVGDPQLRLSVGSFFYSLPDGYWLNVLGFLDLTLIWAILVVAEGVRTIDPRRGYGSSAAILLLSLLAFALALGGVVPG